VNKIESALAVFVPMAIACAFYCLGWKHGKEMAVRAALKAIRGTYINKDQGTNKEQG